MFNGEKIRRHLTSIFLDIWEQLASLDLTGRFNCFPLSMSLILSTTFSVLLTFSLFVFFRWFYCHAEFQSGWTNKVLNISVTFIFNTWRFQTEMSTLCAKNRVWFYTFNCISGDITFRHHIHTAATHRTARSADMQSKHKHNSTVTVRRHSDGHVHLVMESQIQQQMEAKVLP